MELAQTAPRAGAKQFAAWEMVEPGQPVGRATRPMRRLEAGEVIRVDGGQAI